MKTCLMVAEKPSLAQSLAKILSDEQLNSRKASPVCSVHEYQGIFPPTNERVFFKFTSVAGHVMSLDFQARFNSWDRTDPVELFAAQTIKKEASPGHHMRSFLEKEARRVDYLVLWLDCDKEGENICFEVIDCVRNSINHTGRPIEENIYRARFSAITKHDIRHAFAHLVRPNKNEALSVDARQELDLRIGCAFTRFQTKFFQDKYGDLDSNLISFGPCQTPTLGFCVERHDAIQSFKPETYYTIQTEVVHHNHSVLKPSWDRVRVFDKEIATIFLNMLKKQKYAKVVEVSEKDKVKARPQALNTVEMLRVASSALGISPHTTMQIAERLYTQGYISYPRTETTSYSENFDLRGTVRMHQNHEIWGSTVKELLSSGLAHPRRGHDVGDHPPITPMKAADQAELSHDAWRLYEYITRHFIATVSPDCRYRQTTVALVIGKEKLSLVGKTVTDPGYTAIMPWQALPAEENLPACQVGEVYTVKNVSLSERQTGPPDFLSESELITLMEKHGIGTDASIPVHINNICERNYVTIVSGRRLQPTSLGIVLVHGYKKIDIDLVKPTMRAAVEEQLTLIAVGRANYHDVLDHGLDIFCRKFRYFVNNIGSMDELFEVTFSPLSEMGKPLSRCGKCRRYMKLVQSKPVRLHCPVCDETYNLPRNGAIRIYQEHKCPLDGFELVVWSAGGKSYPLCPYCYNRPPFRDMKKGQGCNECTHPSCSHGMLHHAVAPCFECEGGLLVFEPSSGPKWRMSCNKCNLVVNLIEDAHRVQVSDVNCEECDAAHLAISFNRNKTPLQDGQTEYTGCVFCDPLLKDMVKTKHAQMVPTGRGGRGRGRGRGRGGRGGFRGGRGRPRPRPKDKMSQLAAYFV